MTIELEGEYTDARVMGVDEDDVESNVLDQIQAFIDHEAFQNSVKVMPDCHVGSGCTIGFTMPFDDRVVPNAIGVDVGCGVEARNYGDQLDISDVGLHAIDDVIRDVVPMGFDVHSDTDYHLGEDFPWDRCEFKRKRLSMALDVEVGPEWFDGYDIEYYKGLCQRVGYDVRRGISSVGTLGGGNHFIELGETAPSTLDAGEKSDRWITIHSGSRGIGLSIAQYWQRRATELRQREYIVEAVPDEYWKFVVPQKSDPDLVDWFQGGKGESYIDSGHIQMHFEGEVIEEVHNAIREGHPSRREAYAEHEWIDDGDLDYLEGEEAHGYFIDMIFAQTYAEENRWQMFELIQDALNLIANEVITSVHNYLDFEDTVMRKGACRAHEGEAVVLPFNMVDGTLILEAKGNEDWNYSSPHGAGRMMSRTQARNELDQETVEMEVADHGIYSSAVPIDEARDAYKPAELIEDAIGPTVDVAERLVPLVSIKADD